MRCRLKPDDTVCFCFHVSLRKIETFCAVEKPQAASQISDCLSAGTGCRMKVDADAQEDSWEVVRGVCAVVA